MSNSGFFLFDQITYSFLEDGRSSTFLQYILIEELKINILFGLVPGAETRVSNC